METAADVQEKWKETLESSLVMLLTMTSRQVRLAIVDHDIKAVALECLCSTLVPAGSPQQVNSLLQDALGKVEELFTLTCSNCTQSLQEKTVSDTDLTETTLLCQYLQQYVVSLMKCSQHLRTKLPSSSDLLPGVVRVASTNLTAVKTLLKMCKDIEVDYSWAFGCLSTHLGPLFKSTYSLLKVSCEIVDIIDPEQQKDLEMHVVTEVVSRLQSVCQTTLSFDVSLLVLSWKTEGKLLRKIKNHLPEGWNIQPIIVDLCVAMETKAKECVQCAPVEQSEDTSVLFPKLLRICRFLVTLIVKLVQEFEQTMYEFAADIAQMLLRLHSSTPPSPNAKRVTHDAQNQIETNILLVGEPLLSELLNCQQFLNVLINETYVIESQQEFGWAVCLCTLMKFYPTLPGGLQDYLMESASSSESSAGSCKLLDAVFSCVKHCCPGDMLSSCVPGVSCNGQPRCEVTVYEHICTNLSALAASIPPRHFHKLEVVLLRSLVGPHLCCSLLASDTWCFIARWAPSDLCRNHTLLLAKLLFSLPYHPPLFSLVTRMVGFLSDEHIRELVGVFPPNNPENLQLWAYLPQKCFSEPQVCLTLATTCTMVMRNQLQNGTIKQSMLPALRCLAAIFSSPNKTLPVMNTAVTATLQLWNITLKAASAELLVSVQGGILHLMSLQLDYLQPQHTVMVFSTLQELVGIGSLPVALATADFLMHCKALKVSSGVQTQVVQSMVALFHSLIGHTHWLVHHHCMETFRAFAEVTPYADAVEPCIPSQLSDTVIDFLNKIPYLSLRKPLLIQHVYIRQQLHRRSQMLSGWKTASLAKNSTCDEDIRADLCLLQMNWKRMENYEGRATDDVLVELGELSDDIRRFVARSQNQ